MPEKIVRGNDRAAIRELLDWADDYWRVHELPANITHDARLSIEEIVTNIIDYGLEGNGNDEILTRMELRGQMLTIEMTDAGIPFDPTRFHHPDVDKVLDERGSGGMGIHLVRELMDEFAYERRKGKNILRMKMSVAERNCA